MGAISGIPRVCRCLFPIRVGTAAHRQLRAEEVGSAGAALPMHRSQPGPAADSKQCALCLLMQYGRSMQLAVRAELSGLPAPMLFHVQATAELNQERSARLTAEQQVLKLRGQLDAIAQVRAHLPLSPLVRNRDKRAGRVWHQPGCSVVPCGCASLRRSGCASRCHSGRARRCRCSCCKADLSLGVARAAGRGGCPRAGCPVAAGAAGRV